MGREYMGTGGSRGEGGRGTPELAKVFLMETLKGLGIDPTRG